MSPRACPPSPPVPRLMFLWSQKAPLLPPQSSVCVRAGRLLWSRLLFPAGRSSPEPGKARAASPMSLREIARFVSGPCCCARRTGYFLPERYVWRASALKPGVYFTVLSVCGLEGFSNPGAHFEVALVRVQTVTCSSLPARATRGFRQLRERGPHHRSASGWHL